MDVDIDGNITDIEHDTISFQAEHESKKVLVAISVDYRQSGSSLVIVFSEGEMKRSYRHDTKKVNVSMFVKEDCIMHTCFTSGAVDHLVLARPLLKDVNICLQEGEMCIVIEYK